MKNLKVLQVGLTGWDETHLKDEFQKQKLSLKTVRSTKEAFDSLEKMWPEVVWITNIPDDRSPLDLLSVIHKKHPNIPVILSSIKASISDAVQATRLGAFDYLDLSDDIGIIVKTIKSAVREYQEKHPVRFSNDLMSMLIENLPDIIYSLNPQGEFISINPAVETTLGYLPEELLGQSVFNLIVPEDRERILQGFKKSVEQSERKVRTLQFRMMTKAGEAKDFEISRKLYFEEGKVIRDDGIARDISNRKSLERELRLHSEKLKNRIKERTKKLEYSQKQLLALNEVSNLFAQKYNEDDLLDEVPKLLTQSLDFDRAALILNVDGDWELRSYCFGDLSPDFLEGYLQLLNQKKIPTPPHLQQCLDKERAVFIDQFDDISDWPKDLEEKYRIKSLVAAPIRVRGKTIGIIEGDMTFHTRDMDQQDIARFEMFANMVGLGLDNIRAYQDLEKRVGDRTQSLNETNQKLKTKAKELEKATLELANANVQMLIVQEELQEKNAQMKNLISEISQNKEVLQSILDSSLSVLIMVNKEGEIIAINKIVEKFFQIKSDKIIGSKFSAVVQQIKPFFEEKNKFINLIRELQKTPDLSGGRTMEVEEYYRRALRLKSTQRIYLSMFSVPVRDRDKQELGQLWGFIDISQMKLADEKLRAIVEASPIPFIISRQSDGKVLYANQPLAESIGVSPDEALQSYTPNFYADPDERKKILSIIRKQGYVRDYEVKIKRADGLERWMIMSLVPSEIDGEGVVIGALYDINERRIAEEALRKERNFVSAVLDTSGALVIVLDTKGKIVRFNRACEILTGWKFSEVRGKHFWDILILPEENRQVRKTFNDLKAGQFPSNFENYWLAKNKEKFLIAWSNTCLVDERGDVEFIIGTGIDITERKEAEGKLAKRLHYEEGLAACSEALLTHDDMKIALKKALLALRDAVDISRVYLFENFMDENDGLCMRQIYEVCVKGVQAEIDNPALQHFPYKEGFNRWKNKLRKGSYISGLVKNLPEIEKNILAAQDILSILVLPVMIEGEWYGFIGFDDVVSERDWAAGDIRLLQTAAEMIGGYLGKKSAEQALQRSEERFRSLVENAHDIIYSMKPDGTFSYLSPQFTKYTGYQVKEFLGKTLKPLIHPDDYSEPVRNKEFRMINKDQSWRWFTMHSTHIKDDEDQIAETIGIAHDVTEIKNALESLEKTNAELRDTQLQLIQSEKMASLGMLVAGIAHEINTPVGAINSMHNTLMRATEKLRKDLSKIYLQVDQSPKKLESMFHIIDDAHIVISSASERVTNIVRRLRSFARLDEAEIKKVDIHDGIEDTLTIVHHELKHNVSVIKEYGKLPQISCYPGQLNQVFLNLLINAKQSIKGKGTILIRTYRKEDKVFVEIKDSGVGIPREHLKMIFDPGYTTKGVGVGTGLGLSIVYQIIQDHRGDIKVHSEPGKGTTFIVILPVNLEELLNEENANS